MGVDCVLHLPPNVRVRDVGNVIGTLFGHRPFMADLDGVTCAVRVEGVSVVGIENMPQCATIRLERAGKVEREILYHFEGPRGYRSIQLRSLSENIALLRRLADFFGRVVDHQDCDDAYEDYVVPGKSADENHPEDGELWDNLQARVMAVQPLTALQIRVCIRYSAYGE